MRNIQRTKRAGYYGTYEHPEPDEELSRLQSEVNTLEAELTAGADKATQIKRRQLLQNARQKLRMLQRDNYFDPSAPTSL